MSIASVGQHARADRVGQVLRELPADAVTGPTPSSANGGETSGGLLGISRELVDTPVRLVQLSRGDRRVAPGGAVCVGRPANWDFEQRQECDQEPRPSRCHRTDLLAMRPIPRRRRPAGAIVDRWSRRVDRDRARLARRLSRRPADHQPVRLEARLFPQRTCSSAAQRVTSCTWGCVADHGWLPVRLGSSSRLGTRMISIRRFCSRPGSVLFGETGSYSA